jgi:hypothetical protein
MLLPRLERGFRRVLPVVRTGANDNRDDATRCWVAHRNTSSSYNIERTIFMTIATEQAQATIAISLGKVIEGQTAARLIVAADDYGWWTSLLGGGAIVPITGIQLIVASGLARCGLLAETPTGMILTDAGREVAENRGFVRVVTRGWEPTFQQLPTSGHLDFIPAATDPVQVAQGATDVNNRRPDILACVGSSIADADPGVTVDLGCADASRIITLAGLATSEHFIGVDIEEDVVAAGSARARIHGLSDRITMLAGSVQPSGQNPQWLAEIDGERVTTAMSFLLLHQLASDGGGIATVLNAWMNWFPNLRRLVIGDGIRLAAPMWSQQPWFSPTYEIYHAITGVRLWSDEEYNEAFAELGWELVHRFEDHTMLITSILERRW